MWPLGYLDALPLDASGVCYTILWTRLDYTILYYTMLD